MKNRLRKSLAALLTLSMLVGLFPMTAMAAPATDTTDNGVHLTKTLVTRNDAPYIKLEAWTEGDVTSTTAASPADVILVLDQSGSMSGSVSNLKKTAQSFVKDLAQLNTENNDKYRVAIVGFASDPTNTEILTVNGTEWANDYVPVSGPLDTNKDYYVQLGSGYERIHYYDYEFFGQPVGWYVGSSWEFRGEYIDPAKYTVYDVQRVEKESDTPGKQYDELTDADYQGAFDNCTTDTVANNGSLTKAIEALSANGATRADLGMGIAQKIFEAQSDGSSDNRQKVVVFLTDGEPTTSNRFDNNVANGAISAAKAMKDEGAKVYSLYYGSPNDVCENFMQAVSSNYPNATTLNQMGVKIANTYYAAGSNWNGIDDLLQSIIISISAPKLDEQGVVSDTLSKYVRLANTNTGDPNYTKQIETYMVAKTEEGWSSTEQRFNNARVTIANKTVNVSGFAFDDRCVTTSPKDGTGGSDYGAKLVIYIPIAIDAGADTFGGYLPTNDAASIKDADDQTMATAEGVYRDRAMSYTLGDDFARTINAENQDSFTVTLGDSDSTSANAATVNMDTVLSKLITTLPNGANNEGVTMRYELWDTGEDLSDNQGTLMASYDVDQGADVSNVLRDWSNWNWEDNANTGKSYTMDLTNNLARKTFMLRVVLTSTNPKQQLTHNAYGIFELNVQNTDTYDDPSAPLDTFTVTYTDGVDGEEVFADKVIRDLKAGDQTPAFGDHPTRSGYTFTGWEPSVAETVTQSVTYTAQWEKNGGTGPVVTKVKLHYESNGGTAYADETYKKGTVVPLDKHPIREGHTFTGWYADEACTDKIEKITMNGNKTVYAGWKQTDVPSVFTDDHISYVVGFVDGTVKPLANITRAEVASIFYRLLTDEERAKYDTNENSFSDVPKDAWYNTPASTMAAMGIVAGYPDGDFHGSDSITRAEFAAIAARFDDDTDNTGAAFNDISGHWAEKDIVNAANKGWIMGYTDGSFRPNQTITRAEAMSLINRVLQRNPESADDLLAGMIEWPDNMNTAKWYYLPVQEATNSHDYDRKDNGTEKWTALKNK